MMFHVKQGKVRIRLLEIGEKRRKGKRMFHVKQRKNSKENQAFGN